MGGVVDRSAAARSRRDARGGPGVGGCRGQRGRAGLTGQRQRRLVPPGFLLKTRPPP